MTLAGELRLADASVLWNHLRDAVRATESQQLDFDLSAVTFVDGAVMALLVELRAELSSRGITCELVGASERFRPLIGLYRGDQAPVPTAKPEPEHLLEELGGVASEVGKSFLSAIQFLGDLTAALWGVLRRPATGNWRAVVTLSERAGADGVPIILLLNFLVGFVMAFQSSHQ
ncbi:MAG: STAS domain-containing protein, partial [Myxococcales bacterium]|nr:STAS domain-containing protein [Myxococcales bacterium]